MPAPKPLTKNEVIDWISYYEQGEDIPDDIMVRILYMAQLYSEKAQVKEVLTQLMNETAETAEEAQTTFEESDCVEAMHEVENATYAYVTAQMKYVQIFGDSPTGEDNDAT